MRKLVLLLGLLPAFAFAQYSGGGGSGTSGWQREFNCSLQGLATGCSVDEPGLPGQTSPGLSSAISTSSALYGYWGATTATVAHLPTASGTSCQNQAENGNSVTVSCNLFTYQVTDGTSNSDCTVGGGSSLAYCQSNGTAWSPLVYPSPYLAWPGGASSYALFKQFILPSSFSSGSNVNLKIKYRSPDSSHSTTLTLAYVCVSTANPDTTALSNTALSAVMMAAASSAGGLTEYSTSFSTTGCSAGNIFRFQFTNGTGSIASTAESQWISYIFYQ